MDDHRGNGEPMVWCMGFDFAPILTRDMMARKQRSWQLLTRPEMQGIYDSYIACHNCVQNNNHACSGFTITPQIHEFNEQPPDIAQIELGVRQAIKDDYPGVNEMLLEFNGKLMAAGGAIFQAFHGVRFKTERSDIDIFFCGGQDCLAEAVTFLTNYWLTMHNGGFYVRAVRTAHVTTLYLIGDREDVESKVQFIHRLYPNAGSVLGGFDLGPSMMGWDGQHFIATELGAVSVFHRVLLIDTSRRSTSFEHRIKKYGSYCRVVFPAIKPAKILKHLAHVCWPQKKIKKYVNELFTIKGLRLKWTPVDKKSKSVSSRRDGGFEIVQNYDAADRAAVIQEIDELIRARGYMASRTIEIEPFSLVPFTNDEASIEKIYQEIDLKCRPHGWTFKPYSVRKDELFKRCTVKIDLPYIRFEFYPYKTFGQWAFRLPINAEYGAATNDYDAMTPFVVAGVDEHEVSDYNNDNSVWPCWTAYANAGHVAAGNWASISTTCAFFNNNSRPIVSKYLSNNIIVTNLQSIRAAVNKFMTSVYLGDLAQLYHEEHLKLTDNSEEHETKHWLPTLVLGKMNYGLRRHTTWLNELERPEVMAAFESRFTKLLADVKSNIKECQDRLGVVHWIVDNPGRQYTSSINPIIENPVDWYGPVFYSAVQLGNPKLETTLRLIHKIKMADNDLSKLPKDIFKIVLQMIMWNATYSC